MTAPPPAPVDPAQGGEGTLAQRIDALATFVRAAEPYLPDGLLEPARHLVAQATQRLQLSRDLTVVALSGATGGGKSSLFNALVGAKLSPVGVRRPTTGEVHACVFGPAEGATDLLDWLKVEPAYRHTGGAPGGPAGLVLLDLPDFDSVERGHLTEVERVLGLVDLMVWVVDPQKYADQVLHERHLSRLHRHGSVTAVVLNQTDRLASGQRQRLLTDLRRLLTEDGLDGVPVLDTSAVDPPTGVTSLHTWLAEAVSGRRAALLRLAADLDVVTGDLAGLVAAPVADERLDQLVSGELSGGMARIAGAPAIIQAVEASYRDRATTVAGSPVLRWAARLRSGPASAGDRTVPPPAGDRVAPRSAANLLIRQVADRASAGLPAPWPEATATAARSATEGLLDGVDSAAAEVRGEESAAPAWWRLLAAGQWLALAAAVAGLGWYAVGGVLSAIGLPAAYPTAGGLAVPAVLVLAGAGTVGALLLLCQGLARWGARRSGARAALRLRTALADVGRAHVVAPVRAVLRAYAQARDALVAARSGVDG